jgi:hypothetical protein
MAFEITHRGIPVQIGAEKELSMKSLSPGTDRFDQTQPVRFDPNLIQFKPDQLDPNARSKKPGEVTWANLNDAGKAAWITAYRKKFGGDPDITVDPKQPEMDRIDWEHTGELEVVSDVFDDTKELGKFLAKFGWGHITTSLMRGVPAEERKQMLSFVTIANLYIFTHGLEQRGADVGEKGWRFTIKPLSVPTEEHVQIFDSIFDRNRAPTAFSKHNQVNIRGNGKYGDPNRIAFEVRAGDVEDKRRVENALLNSLKDNQWGSHPFEWGTGKFRLVRLGIDVTHNDPQQVKNVPADFKMLAAEVPGVDEATAERVHRFVANARFADEAANARLTQFDQRACVPLLAFAELPGFDEAARARITQAQQHFIRALDALSAKNLSPHAAAEAISDTIVAWAKEAKVSQPLGRWLDGPAGRKAFL